MRTSWIGRILLFTVGLYFTGGVSLHAVTLLPSGDITATTSGWETSKDSGSVINSFSLASDVEMGAVVQLDYNLADGNWVNIKSPSFPSTLNFAAFGDSLKFTYRGDGLSNAIKVELKNVDGQIYQSVTRTTRSTDWTTVVLPFDSITYSYGGVEPTNHALSDISNSKEISEMAFTLNPVNGGMGSVLLDQILLGSEVAEEFREILINDCESTTSNALGSQIGVLNDTILNTVTAVTPISGAYCMKVTNPGSGSGRGYFEYIYRDNNSSSPISVTPYTHLTFYVQTFSAISGSLVIELNDRSSHQVQLQVGTTADPIPVGQWIRVLIRLGNFEANSLDLRDLGKLGVILPAEPVTIYMDKITFESLTYSAQADYVLDNLDTHYLTSSWITAASSGTTLTISTVDGFEDKALKLQYNFTSNPTSDMWIKASRTFGMNVLEDNSNSFRFDYKGAVDNNNANNVEFKVIDNNDTTYFFKVEDMSNTNGEWKTITIPFEDLLYFSGDDKSMNFKAIKQLGWAIAKGDGGAGKFYLHDIRYMKKDDFHQTYPSDRIIQELTIDNNPFAPKTDSALSQATFSFVLNEPAKIKLTIYDLAGNMVVEKDAGEQYEGSRTLVWDGSDDKGQTVRNGLYLYMFTAEGQERTQRIKNVIGVVR